MALTTISDQWRTTAEYDVDWTAANGIGNFVDQHGNSVYGPSDGVNDHVSFTAGSFFTASNGGSGTKCTVELWFKVPVGSAKSKCLFSQRDGTNGFTWHTILHPTTGVIQTYKGPATTNYLTVSSSVDFRDDKWHHLLIVWDSGEAADVDKIKHFVDGVNKSVSAASTGAGSSAWPASFTSPMRIYAQNNPAVTFDIYKSVRHTVWMDEVPTNDAEALARYVTECEAVVTPTKTFTDNDLSDGWVEAGGSPDYVDDQHNLGAGFDANGIDMYLTHATATITDATDLEFWFSVWVNPESIAANGIVLEQTVSVSDQGWYLLINSSGQIEFYAEEGSTTKRTSSLSSTTVSTATWTHIIGIMDNTGPTPNMKLYKNGVEVAYTHQNQASGAGPFPNTGFGTSLRDLSAGARDYTIPVIFYNGIISRVNLGDAIEMSECQAAKHYAEELAAMNSAPVVDNPIPDQDAVADVLFDFTFAADTFSDPNGDALTYTATLDDDSALPAWLTFTGATRNFNGTPSVGDVTPINVKVKATDPGGLFVTDSFLIDITAAPVVDYPIDDQETWAACLAWDFTFDEKTFRDPDDDELTYTATLSDDSALPSWLTFTPGTRNFNGIPLAANVGTISIKVTATDPALLFTTDTFDLVINAAVKSGGGIISKMRKQNAIYWPPGTMDDFGREAQGPLVELIRVAGVSNYRVRWEDKIEEFLDAQGTIQRSNAVVYVPVLWDGRELEVGGFLWLGDRADLTDEAVAGSNPGAYELRKIDKLPTLKANAFLRTAYL